MTGGQSSTVSFSDKELFLFKLPFIYYNDKFRSENAASLYTFLIHPSCIKQREIHYLTGQ